MKFISYINTLYIGVLAFSGAHFGAGTGAINLNDVQCSGSESNILDCSYNENSDCTHEEDASVVCGVTLGMKVHI